MQSGAHTCPTASSAQDVAGQSRLFTEQAARWETRACRDRRCSLCCLWVVTGFCDTEHGDTPRSGGLHGFPTRVRAESPGFSRKQEDHRSEVILISRAYCNTLSSIIVVLALDFHDKLGFGNCHFRMASFFFFFLKDKFHAVRAQEEAGFLFRSSCAELISTFVSALRKSSFPGSGRRALGVRYVRTRSSPLGRSMSQTVLTEGALPCLNRCSLTFFRGWDIKACL